MSDTTKRKKNVYTGALIVRKEISEELKFLGSIQDIERIKATIALWLDESPDIFTALAKFYEYGNDAPEVFREIGVNNLLKEIYNTHERAVSEKIEGSRGVKNSNAYTFDFITVMLPNLVKEGYIKGKLLNNLVNQNGILPVLMDEVIRNRESIMRSINTTFDMHLSFKKDTPENTEKGKKQVISSVNNAYKKNMDRIVKVFSKSDTDLMFSLLSELSKKLETQGISFFDEDESTSPTIPKENLDLLEEMNAEVEIVSQNVKTLLASMGKNTPEAVAEALAPMIQKAMEKLSFPEKKETHTIESNFNEELEEDQKIQRTTTTESIPHINKNEMVSLLKSALSEFFNERDELIASKHSLATLTEDVDKEEKNEDLAYPINSNATPLESEDLIPLEDDVKSIKKSLKTVLDILNLDEDEKPENPLKILLQNINDRVSAQSIRDMYFKIKADYKEDNKEGSISQKTEFPASSDTVTQKDLDALGDKFVSLLQSQNKEISDLKSSLSENSTMLRETLELLKSEIEVSTDLRKEMGMHPSNLRKPNDEDSAVFVSPEEETPVANKNSVEEM